MWTCNTTEQNLYDLIYALFVDLANLRILTSIINYFWPTVPDCEFFFDKRSPTHYYIYNTRFRVQFPIRELLQYKKCVFIMLSEICFPYFGQHDVQSFMNICLGVTASNQSNKQTHIRIYNISQD